MKTWLRSLALSLVCLAPACGDGGDGGNDGPTPAGTCQALDVAQCARQFECYTAEQRMQLGIADTEEECPGAREELRRTNLGFACAEFTAERSNCEAGEVYDAAKAASCRDTVARLTCDEWLADSSPGDCNLVCQPAP